MAPARTRARPWACTRASVSWSYLHGYTRIFTGTRTAMATFLLRAQSRRDQRGRFTQTYAPIQPTQIPPSNDWGAWASGHGVASRCDNGVAATTGAQDLPARLKAGHCACSHILSSNGLATSGYRHQACDVWPAPDSHLLSSRCLSWAGTCICVDSVNVDGVDNVNVIGPAGRNSRRRGRSRYGGMAGQGTGVGKRERARGACT